MKSSEDALDISIRAVVYRDGDEWLAHALDMDIVGAGGTPEEAMGELIEAIECQISFALQSGDPGLITREAPPEIMALWEEANRKSIEAALAAVPTRDSRPHRGESDASQSGPLARFYGLSERKLDDLFKNRMELACG